MVHDVRVRGRIPTSDIALRERQLLESARALFLKRGFDRVSVESLARSARVSPKTIYARYGGKDGLFAAAMKPLADGLVATLDVVPTSARHVERVLAAFGEQLLEITLSAVALRVQRMLVGEALRFPKLARVFYNGGPARGIASVAELLARADGASVLDCKAPREAAAFFLGALQGEALRAGLLLGESLGSAGRRNRAQAAAHMLVAAYRKR
jgi:AcrR family transcriptional regulator